MKCLKCKSPTTIIDARERNNGTKRRRHNCSKLNCNYKFSTIEIPVGRSDNSRELVEWINEQMLVELGIIEPEPE